MLNSTKIKSFFNNHEKGVINIVQNDNEFSLTKDISFSMDTSSITLIGITYIDKKYGNYYNKGNITIPFNQILRIEYIVDENEM